MVMCIELLRVMWTVNVSISSKSGMWLLIDLKWPWTVAFIEPAWDDPFRHLKSSSEVLKVPSDNTCHSLSECPLPYFLPMHKVLTLIWVYIAIKPRKLRNLFGNPFDIDEYTYATIISILVLFLHHRLSFEFLQNKNSQL